VRRVNGLGNTPGLARVHALTQQLARFIPLLTRLLEADLGVDSQRQLFLLAAIAILQAPPFAAIRVVQQKQPAAVKVLCRLFWRGSFADGNIGKRHLGATPLGSDCNCPQATPKNARLATIFDERTRTKNQCNDLILKIFFIVNEPCRTSPKIEMVRQEGLEPPRLAALEPK